MTTDEGEIVLKRGGWFVTGGSWSGPWATKEAAEMARDGEYTFAHQEHRAATERARRENDSDR